MKILLRPLPRMSYILFSITLVMWFAHSNTWGGDYIPVKGPCELVFPRDHDMHPGYRTEWWYYAGNLAGPSGKRYGFQLTFFRAQISPPGAEEEWPPNPSAWRTNQLFFAHAAFSDFEGGRFYYDEKMARGAIALAGVEQGEGITRVYLAPWSVYLESGQHRLQASTDKFTLDLSCRPLKPPVAHGIGGYSLRGKTSESASCYYSFTRLQTFGTVIIGPERIKVKGTAWMDHEFSTPPLEAELTGWDWFSIQLSNNTELMIYLLRNRQGVYDPSSGGTFVQGSGKTRHLSQKDFRVEILDRWKSPRSGAVYPSRWRIRVFPLALDLTLVPSLPDQELITEETTKITYWEGSVSVSGHRREKAIDGVGYVEMTGYAKPFNLPR